jgi:hypothetical protein
MADKKEEQQVPFRLVEAFSNANQAFAESLMAAQERNLKYTQSVFESTLEMLKSHVVSTRSLLEQQVKKQQEASPELTSGPGGSSFSNAFLGFLSIPLAYLQQLEQLLESISQQGSVSFQQAGKSLEQFTLQAREQLQQAVQQSQSAPQKPGE